MIRVRINIFIFSLEVLEFGREHVMGGLIGRDFKILFARVNKRVSERVSLGERESLF